MVTHHRLRPLRTLLPAPGTSTKWPGATRYALYMPLLSTLLGILQVILGAILLSKVYHFGEHGFDCLQIYGSDRKRVNDLQLANSNGIQSKAINAVLDPPLTLEWLSKLQGGDHAPFSLDRNAGPMYNVIAFVVAPIAVTIASVYVAGSHFWSAGVTGGRATIYGAVLMVIWGLVWWGGSLVGVDHKGVVDGYPICVVGDDLAPGLIGDRRERMGLEGGRQWGVLGGLVCVLFYITLAMYAIHLAKKEATQNAERVAYLPPRSRALPSVDTDTELRTMRAWYRSSGPRHSQQSIRRHDDDNSSDDRAFGVAGPATTSRNTMDSPSTCRTEITPPLKSTTNASQSAGDGENLDIGTGRRDDGVGRADFADDLFRHPVAEVKDSGVKGLEK